MCGPENKRILRLGEIRQPTTDVDADTDADADVDGDTSPENYFTRFSPL